MEIVFTDRAVSHPVYGYGQKKETEAGVRFEVPAQVDEALERELRRVARRAFEALGCRDVARVDLRLDEHGRVHFIECNPLPGLSPGFSDLCVVAEAAGLRYHELIAAILEPALRRLRAQRRGRTSKERRSPAHEPEPGEPQPRTVARPGRPRAESAHSSHEATP
jgi:D-alanine-D-alanine ligase